MSGMSNAEIFEIMEGTAAWALTPKAGKLAFAFYVNDSVKTEPLEIRSAWHSWHDGWLARADQSNA